MQANPQLRVNGRKHRPSEDESLQFLSQEEKECLQFFEKTIDSLEEDLDLKPVRRSSQERRPSSGPSTKALVSSLLASRNPSKDQEIIDLVRPDQDFNPTSPDFRNMSQTPDSHFEIKPRRDQMDGLPSEYNPPLPSGRNGPTDPGHSSYHPSGSIPTPVLIAQKIAENQPGGTSNINTSALLRRRSSDLEKPAIFNTDVPFKQGPRTSSKPSRFPPNISMVNSSKDVPNQSLANVNINERRSLMLANLTGTSHPFAQEETSEEKARNAPTRSISFKDPSPDISRMEALSKLGLNRSRAMSGGMSILSDPKSSPVEPLKGAPTKPLEILSVSPTKETISTKLPDTIVSTQHTRSLIEFDKKTEILRRDSIRSQEDKNIQQIPVLTAPVLQSTSYPRSPAIEEKAPITRNPQTVPPPTGTTHRISNYPPPPTVEDTRASISKNPHLPQPAIRSTHYPPPSAMEDPRAPISPPSEVTSLEFNNYGGKSIVVHPSSHTKSELATSPTSPEEPKGLPIALANPSEFNNYGGKTKVMTPAHAHMTRNDLPDILSSHIDKSQTLPARSEAPPPELNSYGGKSRTFNPSNSLNRPSEIPTNSSKASAPATAPKPPRNSYHGISATSNTQKAVQLQRPLSPEHKRRGSNSKFRPQGITVQFSGKGKTDESRREALRKLGLWKESG